VTAERMQQVKVSTQIPEKHEIFVECADAQRAAFLKLTDCAMGCQYRRRSSPQGVLGPT